MSTMLEKVNYIAGVKQNIKTAIEGKGGTVTEDFDSYANAITNLPSGGSCTAGVCFDDGGYDFNEPCLVKMREALKYTKQKLDEWDPSKTDLNREYIKDKQLVFAPKIDTSNVIDMDSTFNACFYLKEVPLLDTSKVTIMNSTFSYCRSLQTIPLLDTSKVTQMAEMFKNCCSLKEVPLFNTRKVTSMYGIFNGCISLQEVPLFDTINVDNMGYMFWDCENLKSVPQFDTRNVINMEQTFYGCDLIKEIPAFNTEKVKNFAQFNDYGMYNLIKINGLSLKSATNLDYTFSAWSESPVQYMLLKDLGTPESVTEYDFSQQAKWGSETPIKSNPEIDVTGASQTVVDSLLTYSFDRKAAGYAVCNLKCHANVKQYLTDEQITAIQNKGYTITF